MAGTVTYSLTDDAGGRFAINASTGVVTVADGSLLNFESADQPQHHGAGELTPSGTCTRQAFTIDVDRRQPRRRPTDANAAANSVAEGAANGTAVGITASSSDVNGRHGHLFADRQCRRPLRHQRDDRRGHGGQRLAARLTRAAPATTSPCRPATASGGFDHADLHHHVTDVATRRRPADANAAANTVAENAANGTAVGITAAPTDANGRHASPTR